MMTTRSSIFIIIPASHVQQIWLKYLISWKKGSSNTNLNIYKYMLSPPISFKDTLCFEVGSIL
jgi:hypothetical protein